MASVDVILDSAEVLDPRANGPSNVFRKYQANAEGRLLRGVVGTNFRDGDEGYTPQVWVSVIGQGLSEVVWCQYATERGAAGAVNNEQHAFDVVKGGVVEVMRRTSLGQREVAAELAMDGIKSAKADTHADEVRRLEVEAAMEAASSIAG